MNPARFMHRACGGCLWWVNQSWRPMSSPHPSPMPGSTAGRRPGAGSPMSLGGVWWRTRKQSPHLDQEMGSRSALIGVENSKPFIAALACPLDLSRSLLFVTPMTVEEKIAGLGLTLPQAAAPVRSEEHTSELQSLMRISYAVFCLKQKTYHNNHTYYIRQTQ